VNEDETFPSIASLMSSTSISVRPAYSAKSWASETTSRTYPFDYVMRIYDGQSQAVAE
jgi:hypothetical protein